MHQIWWYKKSSNN